MSAAAIRSVVLVGGAALLELLCRTGVITAFTMIPPSQIVAGLFDLLRSGRFSLDIMVTLRNVGIAIVAAMIAGPLAALALHHLPALRRILDPLFATYYAIPVYAFYPL